MVRHLKYPPRVCSDDAFRRDCTQCFYFVWFDLLDPHPPVRAASSLSSFVVGRFLSFPLATDFDALLGDFFFFLGVLNNTGILAQELVTHEGPVEQLLKGDINPFGTY